MMAGDVLFFTEALTHGIDVVGAVRQTVTPLQACARTRDLGHPVPVDARPLAASGLLSERQQRLMQIPAVSPHNPVR